jgi:hypothetical protein
VAVLHTGYDRGYEHARRVKQALVFGESIMRCATPTVELTLLAGARVELLQKGHTSNEVVDIKVLSMKFNSTTIIHHTKP